MAYTVSYIPTPPIVGLQPISSVSTVQNHPIGMIVQAFDNGTAAYGQGEFIYLKGLTATAQGTWVTYNLDDGTTALLAANAIGPVAVAMAACDAATKYGWYQIQGKTVGACLASYADNGLVYSTSTGGSVDDAVVTGDLVANAKGASAIDTPATGFAEFEIARPFVNDLLG